MNSDFSDFIRFFPIFRLFPTFRLLDSTGLIHTHCVLHSGTVTVRWWCIKWPSGGRQYAPRCVTPCVTPRGHSISIKTYICILTQLTQHPITSVHFHTISFTFLMIIHCWICNCEIENITQIGPLEKAWGQKLFDQLTHPQYFGFLVNFNPRWRYAWVLKSQEGLRYPPC